MINKLKIIDSRFKSYIPSFILDAYGLKDIFNSEKIESYLLNEYVQNLINELNISTVTNESINSWENFSGLNNENLSIEERVNSVIKKFSFQVHANYSNFLDMLRTYDSSTELKEFIDEYRIIIKTYKYIEYKDFINYLSIINNYKPAHIGFDLSIYRNIYKKFNIVLLLGNNKSITTIIKPKLPKAIITTYNGIIFNSTRLLNKVIKPNPSKIQSYIHKGIVLNRIKIKNNYIKMVSDAVQKPFFICSSFNNVKQQNVFIKNYKTNGVKNYNSLVINKVKIRRCTIGK